MPNEPKEEQKPKPVLTTKSSVLKRCEGKADKAYVDLTVEELKEISNEKPNLADHVTVSKMAKDLKELCK